jgi:hypothetical protein
VNILHKIVGPAIYPEIDISQLAQGIVFGKTGQCNYRLEISIPGGFNTIQHIF